MEVVKNNSMIQSLQIGIGILEKIAAQNRPLKFAEIQELTGLSKSNLYKYINTLMHAQMLYRDSETGAYVLGSKLIKLGMVAADQENILERITPCLEKLSKETNCSVTYSIWTENGPMVLKLFNKTDGFNVGVQVGTILPPGSSIGKIFLAFKEEHFIHEWKKRELKGWSKEQLEALEHDLHMIRREEMSYTEEPQMSFVSSVSFPMFNYQKQLIGAVAVVGFHDQMPKTADDPLSQYIKEISKKISINEA